MKQIFSKQFMIENKGCYSDEQLMNCSFMSNERITLKSILESEIPDTHKWWFVIRKLATKEQRKRIAIKLAEMVLPIYEKDYPDDKRPREGIKAAKDYLKGKISKAELMEKKEAAYVAADAGYAGYAAYAAGAAAYVAAYVAAGYVVFLSALNAATDYPEITKQLNEYLLSFAK